MKAPGSIIKFIPILFIIFLLIMYYVVIITHAKRSKLRSTPVALTAACKQKLAKYNLKPGEYYISPYVTKRTGRKIKLAGYNENDIRAIQRGCNLIADLQGQDAKSKAERWYSNRYIRGQHTSCTHCHQGIGDKQDKNGNRLAGSISLAASWVNGGDAYERFTGLLLPYELRVMQCMINSSNGYKPNIADDIIRDMTAYTRFLSAALNLQIQKRYPEQGVVEIPISATLKRGDDHVRGAEIYKEKCASCHGVKGLGKVVSGRVIFPAIAGPNAFNTQSRNNFKLTSTMLPGFICENMPLGQEKTLTNQECRDIAFFISNLPRPAGDKEGPLAALWQQMMMRTMPMLIDLVDQKN